MEKTLTSSDSSLGNILPEKVDLHLTRLLGVMLVGSVLSFAGAFFFPTQPLNVPMIATGIIFLLILCFIHSLIVKGLYHSIVFVLISFLFSWFTEFIGCNYSLWFGDYDYTNALGPMIGNVPILIIFTWEGVIYPSHLLVDWFSGQSKKGYESNIFKALITSAVAATATGLLVTAWDIMTDPMAVHLKWWVWEFGGEYVHDLAGGVPLSNYWGWFSAVFVISFVYRFVFARGFRYKEQFHSNPLFPIMLYTLWFCIVGYVLLHLDITLPLFIATFTMGPIIMVAWIKYIMEWLAAVE